MNGLMLLCYAITKCAPYHFIMEPCEARLTDDRLRGGRWWRVSEVAAEKENVTHIREKSERKRAQPLHCSLQTLLGTSRKKKVCVCSVTAKSHEC